MVIPLFILLGVFFISIPLVKKIKGVQDTGFSARLGLSAMLLFTGLSHFIFPANLKAMLPEPFPKDLIVYGTGAIEILAAIGLHIKPMRKITAWLLIIYFLAVLPANFYFASRQPESLTIPGSRSGNDYLWYRIPLQLYFILFTYFSSLWKRRTSKASIAYE